MKNKKVSIIIANYNGEKYLNICLKSVLSSKYKNFEIILVDDKSSDNSIKIINSYIKNDRRIILIKNKFNLGAAASRNVAIKKVDSDIVIFLDNDTKVHPYWINELITTLDSEKNIGAAQSLLLDITEKDKIQMAGGKLIKQSAWLIPYNQWNSYKLCKEQLKENEIIAISAALAVKKEVLEIVKEFDEKEAVTTEDLDFCWRIWIAGYSIKLSPKSLVYHWTKKVDDRSYLGNLEQIYFHLAKNSFRSMFKNYELINLIKYLPQSILINMIRGLIFVITRKNTAALMGSIKASYWLLTNIVDSFEKRQEVQKYRTCKDKELQYKIFSSENLIKIYNTFYR